MNRPIQLVTTTSCRQDALQIAEHLVSERLAACAQVEGPLTSVYRWQGALESNEEWRCTVKTDARLFRRITSELQGRHPYDLPELIATPISEGSPDYLQWLQDQLQK